MKTKVKIIIIAIAIISTLILIGLTNSRYFTQVELVGDFEVATAIIDIEEQKEEIEKLLPGDTFEYYFSVNNYDTEGNLNELLMQYSIEIETLDSNVLPLEYTIYELKEDRTTVEITKSNNSFELPYCNSESDKSTRNFKIVFTWDEDKNEAETYADKSYTFKVKTVATYSNYTKTAESEEVTVTSKPYEELEVSIEETDETNVYNVTITNNNDYDVTFAISDKDNLFDISYDGEKNKYLTINAGEVINVQITISEREREEYTYPKTDDNGNNYQNINILISITTKYSAKQVINDVPVIQEKEKVVELAIGSYVAYSPVGSSFTSSATYSGYSSDQTFSTESSNWRVLFIEENTLTLISESTVNSKFYLKGAEGYNNAVLLLNNACNEMYSNESLGAEARSLNRGDIERVSTYNPSEYDGYGETLTYSSSSKRYYPSILKDEVGQIVDGSEGTLLRS